MINEFLAENLNSLEDSEGEKQDWIELRNTGTAPINLNGWSLSDEPTTPSKWVFPNLTLGAGQHLIVFASGKDRKTTASNATNHTNFRLTLSGGGYLGLFNAQYPRVAVNEINYPDQRADISYGRTTGGSLTHFSTLTPGSANNEVSAVSGFALAPHASVKSGFFNQSFNLVLSSETPGAEVRYTLDGKVPTASSELYTAPIAVAGLPNKGVTTIRAASFRTGMVPSTVTTRTYIFPEYVLTQSTNQPGFPSIWDSPCTGFNNCNDINPADYEMDPQVLNDTTNNYRALALQGLTSIPSVSIVTDVNYLFSAGEGVYVRREPFLRKPVSAEFITADGSEGFQIDCGLEMQGQTSPDDSGTTRWKSLKLGLRLFFQGEFGATKLKYKVFEDSPVDSFDTLLLAGGHNNYWNYNNNDTQRTRALYVRDQFMANLQNLVGGRSHHGRFVHVYLNGLYWGLYFIHERPDANFMASYYGGESTDYDVFKHDSGQVVDGSSASYTTMWSTINAGLANNANYQSLQNQLDVPGLVDYLLINFWANNTDWDHKNLYASHRKGGQWRFHAWDSEHTMVDSDFTVLSDNNGSNPTAILNRLLLNAEFKILLADRIHKHFFNDGIFYVDAVNPIYDPAFPARNPAADMFMKMLKTIDTAIVCESARWGDVGPGRENNPHTRNVSFYDERDMVMGYKATAGSHSSFKFSTRSGGLLTQFRNRGWYPSVVAPSFNQHGGKVASGFNLTITAPAGTIYYTTNGSDPRLYGSGAVSPHAQIYSGAPVSVASSMLVKARVLSGTNWSALNEATFTVAELASPLRITEINYNPVGGDAYEFIELSNVGDQPVDLGGAYLDGVTYVFAPNTTLNPGAVLVLANNANPTAFAARYPGVIVAGNFSGSLANGGERIAVIDAAGRTLTSVSYRDGAGWPTAADGGGSSLEMVDVTAGSSDPANWRASVGNGSPGQANPAAPSTAIVINEVAADNPSAVPNAGTFPDWIELRNTTATPVNLEGWSLSDDGNARKFVFPAGTTISANGYLVIWCDASTNTTPGIHAGFALDREGDNVFLYNAQTQRVDAVSFGNQVPNLTIGRIGSSWALTTPTPSAGNAAATLGAQSNLSINEWLANAAPGSPDWVELYNRSSSEPVALRGVYLGAGGSIFQIRSLSFLAPGGFVQLFADEDGGANHVDFKLAAAGSSLSLFDSATTLIESVNYGAQPEAVTQGRLPNGSATIVSFLGSASPGASNYVIAVGGPVLNEVLARNESVLSPWAEYSDWIELANPTAAPLNLAGFSLSDSPNGAGQWVIPSGVTIPANGFVRVWCDSDRVPSTASGLDLNTGFSLSAESGGVYLFNAAGVRIDSVEYGFQIADRSIGRVGDAWRLLATPTPNAANATAAVLGAASAVRLNEWMSEDISGDDWFEIYNPAPDPVSLAGLYVTDDPSIAGVTKHQLAPLSFVGAGDFVKLQASGDVGRGKNHVPFNLNRYGDVLRLYGTNLVMIDSADLVVLPAGVSAGRLPDGSGNTVVFYTTPSPGSGNHLPMPGVAINEVLSHTDPPLEDAIELINSSAQSIDIGGFYLSDSRRDLKKYRIADGTTVAAGGFRVFYENQFGTGAGGFALSSSRGGSVYLSGSDASGNLTGYRSTFRFGPQLNGVSIGRIGTSVGDDFGALVARSFGVNNPANVAEFRTGVGANNGAAKVGPIVISEVMYRPTDGSTNAELAEHEFIELHNVSGASVSLFDPAHATNTWRISGGVSFRFPTGVSIAPRAYGLLVHFDPLSDPAATVGFRAKYGVATSVPLYGPFTGRLANDGDEVIVEMPDAPQGAGPEQGYVPYVVVDRVSYGDSYPWPAEADGAGSSLQRRRTYAYGNDPASWKAASPSVGRANVTGSTFVDLDQDGLPAEWEQANALSDANAADASQDRDGDGHSNYEEYLDGTDLSSSASGLSAPSLVTQPVDATVIPGQDVTLTLVANGSAPLQYQWRKNGFPIAAATNASLTLPSVSGFDSATYNVVVWNGAGFAISSSAKVTVVVPPKIMVQPIGLVVSPGSNVTFTVAASGTGAIRYQWKKDGIEIPGATLPALTINNAQLADEATYLAVVTDDIASVSSQPARLLVKVPPTVAVPLKGSTNLVGSPVTLTIVVNGSVPMGFQWRRGAVILTNIVSMNRTSSYTINSLTLTDSGSYRVIITNSGNFTPGIASATAAILVVEPPAITNQPQSLSVEAGVNATFAVGASGTAPLRYQWSFEGAGIPGATNSTYRVTNAQIANAGAYRVVVSNVGASVTSAVATLSILGQPTLSGPELLPNGHARLFILGAPNRTYTIESSLNLTNWTFLGTLAYTNGLMPYIDTSASGATNRFYRARE
ncbi:MAG: lamin tail domain-containing protein [Verrucomicrobia bacterium]|nr:lamin tail domain-containing protein [Verrucomicrobiota bacterium]